MLISNAFVGKNITHIAPCMGSLYYTKNTSTYTEQNKKFFFYRSASLKELIKFQPKIIPDCAQRRLIIIKI